jgi:ATP-dependent DNA helicase RecG
MIPQSESLTVEFKSDRKRLSDAELVEALVCLSNTEGGELWLGVEDDGQATGLHVDHMTLTGLAGMVAARTSPAVHVRLEDEALVISNPGGLVDGVTLANLLVTEPRPRNRALADAMKRIGVVERSGRGVDTIYQGMLKFGRPAPDYGRTDLHNVVLSLPTVPADVAFRRMVVDAERNRNAELPIDSLIALAALREFKRLPADALAMHIQRDAASAKRTLEALTEAGLVEAHGNTRGRSYTLLDRAKTHLTGVSRLVAHHRIHGRRHEQMLLSYIRQHGQIKRAEVMALCRLTEGPAKRLLQRMLATQQIVMRGQGKTSAYVEPK